jgi:tetratricopeptide (TPR) repeat protein
MLQALQGRLDDGLAQSRRAMELDPLSPLIQNDAGIPLVCRSEYEAAKKQNRKALELDPNFAPAQWGLGWASIMEGNLSEAILELEKGRAMAPTPLVMGWLGFAYATSGDRAKAQAVLHELNQTSSSQFFSEFSVASVYLGLGDKERALDLLQKAYEARSQWMIFLKVDKIFDSLRSDPRFIALLKKVGPERCTRRNVAGDASDEEAKLGHRRGSKRRCSSKHTTGWPRASTQNH